MGATGRKASLHELTLLWQNWNSPLNIGSIICSWSMALLILPSATSLVVFSTATFIYVGLLILYDVLYYANGISVIDENEAIRAGYNLGFLLDDEGSATGEGLDYGFNFYNGDFKKSRRQAQLDKFEYCWNTLGLKEGMTVIDCGCGCGDWLMYVKSRGAIGIGINITEAQVKVCSERGLNVLWTDWKKIQDDTSLQKTLYGKADAVTMWDTIEHYVPGKYYRQKSYAKQDAIYLDLFELVKKCFKPNTPVGKAWTSCLHYQTTKVTFTQQWNNYILDKFHSGCYPTYENRQLSKNAKKAGFEVESERNLTEDYYMTSVISPHHFGRFRFRFTFFHLAVFLVNIFLDPSWIQRIFWFFQESWMYQFTPSKLEDSPMQLLWIAWKLP